MRAPPGAVIDALLLPPTPAPEVLFPDEPYLPDDEDVQPMVQSDDEDAPPPAKLRKDGKPKETSGAKHRNRLSARAIAGT